MLQAGSRIASGQWPYRDFWTNYMPGQPLVLALLQQIFGPSLLAWRVVRTLTDATRRAARLPPRSPPRARELCPASRGWRSRARWRSPPARDRTRRRWRSHSARCWRPAAGRRWAVCSPASPACSGLEIGVAAIIGVTLEAPIGARARAAAVGAGVWRWSTLAPFFLAAPGRDVARHLGLLRDPGPAAAAVPARVPRAAAAEQADRVLHPADPRDRAGAVGAGDRDARRAEAPGLSRAPRWAEGSRRRCTGPPGSTRRSLSLVPLALVGLAYLIGRADVFHLVPLAAVLPVMLAQAAAAAEIAAVRIALLCRARPDRAARSRPPRRASSCIRRRWPRCRARRATASRPRRPTPAPWRSLERSIQGLTAPGEPIFVANPRHDRVTAGDPLLYVILGHPNPTRYDVMQPGLVTTASVQREIVDSLRRSLHARS